MADLTIRTDFTDGEPRMHHLELGRRLGYARDAKVSDLIKRLMRDGYLNESEVFPTAGQTSKEGGRPRTDYWLSETACLIITTQSGTEHAARVTREVCELFVAHRRGLVPALDLAAIETRIGAMVAQQLSAHRAEVTEQLTALRRDSALHGVIAPADLKRLRAEVAHVAALLVMVGERESAAQASPAVYKALEQALRWSPTGARWAGLPDHLVAPALQHLGREKQRLARALSKTLQAPLDFGTAAEALR